mmetsp:Transcript_34024/g.85420  ORF Transcript_34024/g.85420 Transcript_34024/m.85420 type:complete len:240 (+) Transcript_34024:1028-1747(+)
MTRCIEQSDMPIRRLKGFHGDIHRNAAVSLGTMFIQHPSIDERRLASTFGLTAELVHLFLVYVTQLEKTMTHDGALSGVDVSNHHHVEMNLCGVGPFFHLGHQRLGATLGTNVGRTTFTVHRTAQRGRRAAAIRSAGHIFPFALAFALVLLVALLVRSLGWTGRLRGHMFRSLLTLLLWNCNGSLSGFGVANLIGLLLTEGFPLLAQYDIIGRWGFEFEGSTSTRGFSGTRCKNVFGFS